MTIPMVILSALAIGAIAAAFWAMFREYQIRRETERAAEWSARMHAVQTHSPRGVGEEHFDDWGYTADETSHVEAGPGAGSAAHVTPSELGRPAARYVRAVEQTLSQTY